jgi:hypothetical protein
VTIFHDIKASGVLFSRLHSHLPMRNLHTILSFGTTFLSFTSAYKWPNPLIDRLDHELHDQFGYNAGTIVSTGITTCSFNARSATTGRQVTAEV